MLTAATFQMDVQIGKPERNTETILKGLKTTEADVVVFPECSNSGYCFSSRNEALPFAEQIPGAFTDALCKTAKQTGRWAAVGLLEIEGSDLFNTAVLAGPGGELHIHRKTHLPYLGVDRFVVPGDKLAPIVTPIATFGLVICYEWRFPEVARILSLQGAEVLLGVSNWPEGAKAIPEKLIAARAAENRVWIVSANRVGVERDAKFIGMSSITDPNGDVVVTTGDQASIIKSSVDSAASRTKKFVRVPGEYEIDLFGDRRPTLYGHLIKE
jgi:5-aminopentanamidase